MSRPLSKAPLTLALTLLVGAAPLRVDAAPSRTPEDRSSEAKALYAAGDYARAARAFEALWRDSSRPGDLFNAGMARDAAGAGHEALAIQDLRRYLSVAPMIAADQRADLDRRIATAEQSTAPVEISYEVGAGSPAPIRIELHRDGASPEDTLTLDWSSTRPTTTRLDVGAWTVRVVGPNDGVLVARSIDVPEPGDEPIRVPMAGATSQVAVSVRIGPERALTRGIDLRWEGPAEAPPPTRLTDPCRTWQLPSGEWVLHATARGFLPGSKAVRVGQAPARVDLRLRRDPEASARLGLGIAMGAATLGLVATGVALASVGRGNYREHVSGLNKDDLENPARKDAVDTLLLDSRLIFRGVGLGAAGLGTGVVATTVAAGGGRRALLAEFGIGAALTIAGAIGVPQIKRHHVLNSAATADEIANRRDVVVPMYGVLGLGIGMTSASVVALLTRELIRRRLRKDRPAGITTQVSLQGASLAFTRRF